ncbi:MAG: bifunctional phosphoribosylaminoimidazolecarboxamide formyltransferase/IMP cyclohydrolase [Elusimicrobiota bacterium]|jgi:phosphoribosylaminoimidazolecarboxamide formyltransferase/IMP cyclohydrolase
MSKPQKRVLISVTDKTGIVEFANELRTRGYEIISTGGTAKKLKQAEVPVREVEELTGYPEILDGRVKTLHPKIFGALLAIRGNPRHEKDMAAHDIEAIDMVVVNLYPFEKVVTETVLPEEELLEYIDIGGVTLLRAAGKNFHHVTIVSDPADYAVVLQELADYQDVRLQTKRRLAAKAFAHTARYDAVIASYFRERQKGEDVFPREMTVGLKKVQTLRYGENPHQKAAIYQETGARSAEWGIVTAKKLQGKELSYNNYLDLEAAWSLVSEFQQTACVIVKHNTPCGVALADKPIDAFHLAQACDPMSAFGGIVGFNKVVDGPTAEEMVKIFLECIIAPGYRPEAMEVFKKKENLRLLELPQFITTAAKEFDLRRVSGGLLVQEKDYAQNTTMKTVTKKAPSAEAMASLEFAWRVVKHVKSNAIVLARGQQTIGLGAGQMSRIDALRVAWMKFQQQQPLIVAHPQPLVLASDAFFPFRDCVDEASRMGIAAIVQPGGSIHDEDSIRAADEHGIAMVFTGMRHFRH